MPLINYLPSGKFAFPRGYIRSIACQIDHITSFVYSGDGKYTAHFLNGDVETDFFFFFNEAFITPSTARKTLDFMLIDATYINTVSHDELPLPCEVQVLADEERDGFVVVLTTFFYFPTYARLYVDLPEMPSTYWLPD